MSAVTPDYLPGLINTPFLPVQDRLFAAFSLPLNAVNHVLFGEGPYPREESATGFCFMDGAVKAIWQPGAGLATSVNRATSLRNFIKMLLVADGVLTPENTSASALQPIADQVSESGSDWILTRQQLQDNFINNGFLLLNASLVYRSDVAPALDVKAWQPLIRVVLAAMMDQQPIAPTLICWGKLAQQIKILPEANKFPCIVSEHPYNLSFIRNPLMQHFFKPFRLLKNNLTL